MSQRDSGSRHDTGTPSRSPKEEGQYPQPTIGQAGSRGGDVVPGNTSNMAYTDGGQRLPIPPRTLGVQNFLNPSGQRSEAPERGLPAPHPILPGDQRASAPPYSPYGGPQAAQPGSQPQGSYPGTPYGSDVQLAGPTPTERKSPAGSYPFPTLKSPRKILSPKPPRASSFGQGLPHPETDRRTSPFIPASSPVKRPYEPEVSQERLQQVGGPAAYSPSQTPVPQSQRSVSQPVGGPQAPREAQFQPAHAQPPNRAPSMPPQSQTYQPATVARSFSSTAVPGAYQNPAWQTQDPSSRARANLALAGVEGQQTFMALPGSDEPIQVDIDYLQGSRKADEKRRNNAKASTRHRRKKKTIEEERKRELEDQKDQNQDLMQTIHELAQQRDFYRSERNRLRDLVSRTPGISEHASGPPSPNMARGVAPAFERSPGSQPALVRTPSQSHVSEGSSVERPAQRRRIDEFAEPGPIYRTSTGAPPTALPPAVMHGQPYGAPAPMRPLSATSVSSGSGERLPPLRAMEGTQAGLPPPSNTSGPYHPQGHAQDPRTGQWIPITAVGAETGWATSRQDPARGPPPR